MLSSGSVRPVACPMTDRTFSTLVAAARHRSEESPNAVAYTFLQEGTFAEARLTYGEIASRARRVASALQTHGLGGGRAILLYPPELDFITTFLGCLYAGVIAVPAYPPDPARLSRTISRLHAIVRDARA